MRPLGIRLNPANEVQKSLYGSYGALEIFRFYSIACTGTFSVMKADTVPKAKSLVANDMAP